VSQYCFSVQELKRYVVGPINMSQFLNVAKSTKCHSYKLLGA